MSTLTDETTGTFDGPDRLNDDGTVTFRITPSNWHAYNISPDTYQTVNGDSWVESTIEYANEQVAYPQWHETPEWAYLGRPVHYDDFEWTYDHRAIVYSFGETLMNWISASLMEMGLTSLRDVSVVDSWSPQFYNFTSDGFEVELTCDPEELRGLSEGFDVDEWAHEHYRSYDGFHSYVTGRMSDPDWRAGYDGEFRIESLFAGSSEYDVIERGWIMALCEDEYEVYMEHTWVEFKHPEFEDSGFTLPELEEWAASLTFTQTETLPGL